MNDLRTASLNFSSEDKGEMAEGRGWLDAAGGAGGELGPCASSAKSGPVISPNRAK